MLISAGIVIERCFTMDCDDLPPADGPGNDCPDHGPYADEECPKC
jgi:hypothetical protein